MINLIDLFGCYLGEAHLRPPYKSLVGKVGAAPALQDFQSCTSTELVSTPLIAHRVGFEPTRYSDLLSFLTVLETVYLANDGRCV